MSIATELNRLKQNRQAIVDAVNAKGGELAENAPLNAIASAIEALPSGGGMEVLEGEVTIATTTSSSGIFIYDDRITPDNFEYAAVWNEELIATPQANRIIWINVYNIGFTGVEELECGTGRYTATGTSTLTTNRATYSVNNGRVELRAAASRQWAAGDVYKYLIRLKK